MTNEETFKTIVLPLLADLVSASTKDTTIKDLQARAKRLLTVEDLTELTEKSVLPVVGKTPSGAAAQLTDSEAAENE